MKLLNEIAMKVDTKGKGTYAAVRFSSDTVDRLRRFCDEYKIPNALKPTKYHTTVLYSRKYCPDLDIDGDLKNPVIGTPEAFLVWKTRSEDPKETPKNCLVLKYRCTELVQHHKDLMKEHGASYDFDEYQPHITLSYDIGDLDVEELEKHVSEIGEIIITSEYSEDLDLNWHKTKGKK